MSAVVVLGGRKSVSKSGNDSYNYNIKYAQPNQTKRMSVVPREPQTIKINSLMPPDARFSHRDSIRNSPVEQPYYYEPSKRSSVMRPDIPIYFDKEKSVRNSGMRPEFYPSPVPPDSSIMPPVPMMQRGQNMYPRQIMQEKMFGRNFNQMEPESNFNTFNEMATPREMREVAGFFQQMKLLAWKNLLITIRNLGVFFLEILAPILVIGSLILIRYCTSVHSYPTQSNSLNNVFNLYSPTIISPIVLYYPDNPLILSIVTDAISIIQSAVPSFVPNIIASNVSNGSLLDSNTLSNLSAFIAFPSSYNTTTLPQAVQYTIYTQE
jgi:hypothetical protein